MTRSENVMENNNQIDLKFWKKNNISSLHSKRYLRRLSADIFMVELENSLLPDLTKYITFWKRNVDDAICFVKKGTTEFIISVFNSFEKNIQFTFE